MGSLATIVILTGAFLNQMALCRGLEQRPRARASSDRVH